MAGMSRDQVDLVVRIEKRLEDKPVLREALVNGEISVNKLARVVSIVTVENQQEILKKVESLSKVALEVFVKDVKRDGGNPDGFPMRKNELIAVPGHGLQLDEDIENELAQMQEKEREDRAIIGYPAKRHIPAEIRKIVKEEFGEKCAMPRCQKPAENLHHEKGFAKTQTHNPYNMRPLCKGHHELAHEGG